MEKYISKKYLLDNLKNFKSEILDPEYESPILLDTGEFNKLLSPTGGAAILGIHAKGKSEQKTTIATVQGSFAFAVGSAINSATQTSTTRCNSSVVSLSAGSVVSISSGYSIALAKATSETGNIDSTELWASSHTISANAYYRFLIKKNDDSAITPALFTVTATSTPTPTNPIPIIDASEDVTASNEDGTQSNSITLSYTLKSVGNVADELVVNEDGSGQIVRRVGEIDLGTLTYSYTSNWNGFHIFNTQAMIGIAKIPTNNNDIANIMCERFKATSRNIMATESQAFEGEMAINTGGTLMFGTNAYSSVDAFKSAMSGVMLCYELATPTTETLTPEEVASIRQLQTYKGTTVIASQLEGTVTYVSNEDMGSIISAVSKTSGSDPNKMDKVNPVGEGILTMPYIKTNGIESDGMIAALTIQGMPDPLGTEYEGYRVLLSDETWYATTGEFGQWESRPLGEDMHDVRFEVAKLNGHTIQADVPADAKFTDTVITQSDVAGWGFTKTTGTYSKPSGGIPASDLASGVIPTTLPASDVKAWAKADNKPSYTASEVGALASTVTHLSGDIATTEKGSANGVATLGSDGKIPSSQLPSYVDDVLEYSAKSSFPATGETGKIYVNTADNKTYRWSGSAYVEISPSLALGETSSTAYAGDKGKALADKLKDIESGAQVNVQSDWNITDTTSKAYIKNKPQSLPANGGTATNVSGTVAIANGGTGATTASGARTNLGLGGAATKGVDTSISAASTSANLPTAAAVASFVEGKGYKTTDNNTTYTFATGDGNGQIKVTPSGGTAQNITVKGLGSLAYSSATIPTVVNNLTSDDTGKALSAKQGKELKSLIDALTTKIDNLEIFDEEAF